MHKKGVFRGEKLQDHQGTYVCVWIPFNNESGEEEDMGLCFDFHGEDLQDLIDLLIELRDSPADLRDFAAEDAKEASDTQLDFLGDMFPVKGE